MSEPIVIGPAYSSFVMTARLALEEKGVAYRFEDHDILAEPARSPTDLARIIITRQPSFEADGLALNDANVIAHFVDEGFAGPSLQPRDVRRRAAMNQMIVLVQDQLRVVLLGKIAAQRVIVPFLGGVPDERIVQSALPIARQWLAAFDSSIVEGPYLLGKQLTLADLMLTPIFFYFAHSPEAAPLLAEVPRLSAWWQALAARPSLAHIRPVLD